MSPPFRQIHNYPASHAKSQASSLQSLTPDPQTLTRALNWWPKVTALSKFSHREGLVAGLKDRAISMKLFDL